MTGVELIAQEREEQINKHGRTYVGDLKYKHGELKLAATALVTNNPKFFPFDWDETVCDKMINKTYKERLVVAGALIAAEIDRLQNLGIEDE